MKKIALFTFFAAITGCDTNSNADAVVEAPAQGAGGKADAVVLLDDFVPGTCLDAHGGSIGQGRLSCDGPAVFGECQCDEECEVRGDCCYDYKAMCVHGDAEMNFVKLRLNDNDVLPAPQLYEGAHPDEYRSSAGTVIHNVAHSLARRAGTAWPPYSHHVAYKDSGSDRTLTGTSSRWYSPYSLPQYVDAVLAWAQYNLSPEDVAQLKADIKSIISEQADAYERGVLANYAEEGWSLDPDYFPAYLLELSEDELQEIVQTKSLYDFAE